MNLNEPLLAELKHEATSTRRMLERIPAESFGWKPHEKSMTLMQLAGHVAGITNWLPITVNADEFDILKRDNKPKVFTDTASLLYDFEDNLAEGTAALQSASNESLTKKWRLRSGEHVIFEMPRAAVVRHYGFESYRSPPRSAIGISSVA
ncbi:MAG: DinB family protein [Segetibacter sp.]